MQPSFAKTVGPVFLVALCAIAMSADVQTSSQTPELPAMASDLNTPPFNAPPSEQRQQAAETLRAALLAENEAAALQTAAKRAADQLGPHSDVASRLRQLAKHKRGDLHRELTEIASDLVFEPRTEAKQPQGFPDFTPVGELAVHQYPRYRMVQAEMKRNWDTSAFNQLFSHIKSHEIPMTSPVQIEFADKTRRPKRQKMAFLYERPEQGTLGKDGSVSVVDVSPKVVLSIGYRGWETPETLADAQARFDAWLEEHDDYEADGGLRAMSWNSPAVPERQRYYQLQQPIRAKTDAAPASDAAQD